MVDFSEGKFDSQLDTSKNTEKAQNEILSQKSSFLGKLNLKAFVICAECTFLASIFTLNYLKNVGAWKETFFANLSDFLAYIQFKILNKLIRELPTS